MGDERSTQNPRPKSVGQRHLSLGPRMKLAMYSLEPLLIDMGVNLCGRYVRMAEHLLDDSKIRAIA